MPSQPKVLEKYSIKREIGRGAYGIVSYELQPSYLIDNLCIVQPRRLLRDEGLPLNMSEPEILKKQFLLKELSEN